MSLVNKLRLGFLVLTCVLFSAQALTYVALTEIEQAQAQQSQVIVPRMIALKEISNDAARLATATQQLALQTDRTQLTQPLRSFSTTNALFQKRFGALRTDFPDIDLGQAQDAAARIGRLVALVEDDSRSLSDIEPSARTLFGGLDAAVLGIRLGLSDLMTETRLAAGAPNAPLESIQILRRLFVAESLAQEIESNVTGLKNARDAEELRQQGALLRINLNSMSQTIARSARLRENKAVTLAVVNASDVILQEHVLDIFAEQIERSTRLEANLISLVAELSSLQQNLIELVVASRSDVETSFDGLTSRVSGYVTILAISSIAALVFSLGFLLFVVERQIALRLKSVANGASRIEAGDLDRPIALKGRDEIALIGQSLERLREISLKQQTIEADLVRARQSAESLAKAKTEFLAMMSHEIRTPLNAITGMFELIERSDIPARQKLRAEKGKEAAEQLFQLLSKILNASRIEAGSMEIFLERVRIADLASFAKEALTGRISSAHKGLTCEVNIDTDVAEIESDATLLRQVISNLVDNAVRFTKAGAISITFRDGSAPGVMAIDVTDTGIGLTDEAIAFIFQPFRQVDSSMRRKSGGSGLGLSISQNIAKLLNGELSVESTVGQGTTFTLAVPLRPDEG